MSFYSNQRGFLGRSNDNKDHDKAYSDFERDFKNMEETRKKENALKLEMARTLCELEKTHEEILRLEREVSTKTFPNARNFER